jgi:predicted dehydrogenase
MQKINWGIIGLGSVAKEFADAFNEVKNANLLAVASRDYNKIKIFKNNHQIQNDYCF